MRVTVPVGCTTAGAVPVLHDCPRHGFDQVMMPVSSTDTVPSTQPRTPFSVRHVGITNLKYPDIITKAQEAAAERREAIQQEEAQTQVSAARLERELREARLQRAIEKEKAETEALAQATLAASVDSRVLELRKLENQRAWIEKWDGQLPTTVLGDAVPMVTLK